MQFKDSIFPVLIISAVVFIPFLGAAHLFDWDEINFAESAREMLITHEYFRVQINFQPFWEKPPLFFWLQALSMQAFGVNEFAARFPNAICGILTLSLLFHIGSKNISNRFAWLWVLFMMGSLTPALYFKTGIIDPWFNLFIFYAIWQMSLAAPKHLAHKRSLRFVLIGISLGLAVLTKGPVALLIAGLCGLTYIISSGFYFFFNWKQLLICIAYILFISSIWVAIEVSKNGFAVITDFINYQIDLFKNPVAGHGQPWFYHAVVLLFGCFPASIFAIQGFFAKAISAEERNLKQWMAFLFWVVLILFSLVTTKIVHYSSLCWLPITFMAALAVDKMLLNGKSLHKLLVVLLTLVGTVISLLLFLLPLVDLIKPWAIPYIKDPFAVASLSESADWLGIEWIIGLVVFCAFAWCAYQLWHQQVVKAVYPLLVVMLLSLPLYVVWVVPKIEVYSQRPAIEFYQSLIGQDVYVESLGHKSYAQYFYAQTQPHTNPLYKDNAWLLEGEIDKPVYFVVKVNHLEKYLQYNLTEVARKGGFVLVKREPKTVPKP